MATVTANELSLEKTLEELITEFNTLRGDVSSVTLETLITAASSTVVFEGTTDDAYETTLAVVDPTADRTITLPNVTGTVITDANSDTPATTTTFGNLDQFLINDGGVLKKMALSTVITNLPAITPAAANTYALGSAALEWSDLFLGDSSVINFGNDQDTTLTHTDGVGLALNLMMAATTFEPTGDTASGDNAAIGYTAAEGLILTGQGSTSDVTLKNDADGTVFTVPTGTDDILFPDSAKAIWGAGSDLSIWHDGSNSYINDAGTGQLYIKSNFVSFVNAAGSETMAAFDDDGAVTLYYDNTAALATASAAVNVTGDLTATLTIQPAGDTAAGDNAAIGYTAAEGLILTGQGSTSDITLKNDADETVFTVPTGTDDILFPDNAKAIFGAGSDFQIYHSGSHSYVGEVSGAGTGNMYFAGDNLALVSQGSSESYLQAVKDGAVTLYYDNTAALATASGGGTLTGSWAVTTSLNPDASDGATLGTNALEWSDLYLADGAVIYAGDDQDWQATHITDNEMRLADGDKWGFGAGGDLTIHHDGSNSYISDAGTGSLYVLGNTIQFNNAANTEPMLIASEDGAVTLYHDAASKLATSATGVSVTGDVIASGAVEPAGDTAAGDNAAIGYTAAEGLILTGQGSTSDITVKNDADATVFTVPTGTDDILFPDSAKAMWGAGSDLSLYHDGSNSYIDSGAVGSLYMRVNATENAIVAIQNSGVIVYYDGTEKLQTTSAGGTLTGTWNVTTNLTVAGNLTVTGTTTTVDTVTMNAANAVVFEGATADNYETTLSIVDPTADHTQYLINQGGYIPVLAAVTTTAITSTPAELNLLDTATAGTVVNSKALIYGGSGQVAATTLAVSSTSVFSGHVSQGDNIKTYYGTGNDLEIYHDGSNSYIKDTGTGALITYGSVTKISGSSGEDGLNVTTGGAVEAYYANAKKFETTSAGATVTGVLTATLQANAIDSDHYVDDSIDTAHYAAGSVDATALGADCVTAAKIGDNVINSEHYAADSIDEEHLANDCVGSAELKTLSTLLIKNAAGSTLKTLHCAGA